MCWWMVHFSHPGCFSPITLWTRCLVGVTARLVTFKKRKCFVNTKNLLFLFTRPTAQSLYWLSCPNSLIYKAIGYNVEWTEFWSSHTKTGNVWKLVKSFEIYRLNVSILNKNMRTCYSKVLEFRTVQSTSCNYLEPDTFSPHPMPLRHFNIILPSIPSFSTHSLAFRIYN
jgi:hypothetical protein